MSFNKPRVIMVSSTVFILSSLIGALIGLTLGLREQPPPNGGSPLSLGIRSPTDEDFHYSRKDDTSTGNKVIVKDKAGDMSAPAEVAGTHGSMKLEPAHLKLASEYRTYRYAAVTTETDYCSKTGTDILGRGQGSAVDAAIASYLCSCVVNAHSCGIGGGLFMTIYEASNTDVSKVKELMTLIAREMAPAAADKDMFVNTTDASHFGGKAVAVPGEIYGLFRAWQRYGRMLWRDLFTEAIRLCEEGFIVERSLSDAINQYNTAIRADPNLGELFLKEDGTLIKTGDLLVNPKLGATFRIISNDPMSFYSGQLAADIVADLAEYDGIITLEDMASYQSVFKPPVTVTLDNGDYKVYSPPPPASGVVLSFILNILDGYNFASTSVSDDEKILTYHRIIEAFKFAYAKRSALGDEDFEDIQELLYNLTSDEYCSNILSQIDDESTHDVDYYGPSFEVKPDHGTAHMNVLAPDGAAVALTGTINLFFGAKVRGRRTGIIFNDEMDDFSTPGTINEFGVPASPSNYIYPGKRPMSSMTPTLILDKNNHVVFQSGGAGGTRISTATSFVAMNSLWFGLGLDESSDTTRIHHQLLPNNIVYENTLDAATLAGLQAKNHVTVASTAIAVAGSIRNKCGEPGALQECIEAVSDGRKGGAPDGF